MEPTTGVILKLENTWRLIALGRRFLAQVDVDEIHLADLAQFVATWRTALDDPMTVTTTRVDELAAMIAIASRA
jgi:hypothetical protein